MTMDEFRKMRGMVDRSKDQEIRRGRPPKEPEVEKPKEPEIEKPKEPEKVKGEK